MRVSSMRFAWVVGVAIGAACLIGAAVTGTLAIRQAGEVSAYSQARPCLAGAPLTASCTQLVTGAVTAVTEVSGKGSQFELDIMTGPRAFDLTFSSASPMLDYATDGAPAVVTVWRGIAVAAETDGRSQQTTAEPRTALARDLADSAETAGIGGFLVLGGLAMRRNRRTGSQPVTSPLRAALLVAAGLGSVAVLAGGVILAGQPSRLGPDLAGTGAALAVIAGLSVWAAISVRRRNLGNPAGRAGGQHVPGAAVPASDATPGATPSRRTGRNPGRAHPAAVASVLSRRAAGFAAPALTVAVLFGTAVTAADGSHARSFRQAPACSSAGASLTGCAGSFTATINGVRASAQSSPDFADVSYVADSGAINSWARFDGNGDALAATAQAEMSQRAPLRIEVWRGSVIGAELGGSWHWAQGDPPGDTIPVIFLSVSFALLLAWLAPGIYRRGRPGGHRLLLEYAGLAAVAAGAIVLLAYGIWPGVILVLAVLARLAWSATRSRRQARDPLLASLGSP
jgi:hypothetical protein